MRRLLIAAVTAASLAVLVPPPAARAADALTELEAYAAEAGRMVGHLEECGLYDEAANIERNGHSLLRSGAALIGTGSRVLVARLRRAKVTMALDDPACDRAALSARLDRYETASDRLGAALQPHMDRATE